MNAEMPTLNQAAYVGESRGMRKAKRLGGDERITRPRAPERLKKVYEIVWTARKRNVQKRGIKSPRVNMTTTIQQRSGKLADNVTYNNGLLFKLRERGNVRPFGGGNVILNFGATE